MLSRSSISYIGETSRQVFRSNADYSGTVRNSTVFYTLFGTTQYQNANILISFRVLNLAVCTLQFGIDINLKTKTKVKHLTLSEGKVTFLVIY